ncbi:MAG: regulatory protein RecX [Butyrivibrio sp.]|nr:regulatory protein RecX [Butyrivibrio sp.]
MIISDVVEFDKRRSKIFIDGEFAFVLYKGELCNYGISKDRELSEETYLEITRELLPKRATKQAMELLVKKDYTEKKLRDTLSEGLYPVNCIDTAIEYVKSYNYLDDERYARDYISYHIELKGRNRIIRDLMNKGVSKDVIEAVLDDYGEEECKTVETEQIKKLLIKKHYSSDMDYKEKQKIIAFLMRRGYSLDVIKTAMDVDLF